MGSHARRFFVNSGQQWSTVRTDGDAGFHVIVVTACYVVGVIVAVRMLILGVHTSMHVVKALVGSRSCGCIWRALTLSACCCPVSR